MARQNEKHPPTTQPDLAQDEMGDNSLQGNDQRNVRNQRGAQPDERTEPDDLNQSFDKLDKDVRASHDLGKGNRTGARR